MIRWFKISLLLMLGYAVVVSGQDFNDDASSEVSVRISISQGQIHASQDATLTIKVKNPKAEILRGSFPVYLSGKENYWSPGKNPNYPQDQDIIFVDPKSEKVITLRLSEMKWGIRKNKGKPNLVFYQIAKPGRWILDMELKPIVLYSGSTPNLIGSNNLELVISN